MANQQMNAQTKPVNTMSSMALAAMFGVATVDLEAFPIPDTGNLIVLKAELKRHAEAMKEILKLIDPTVVAFAEIDISPESCATEAYSLTALRKAPRYDTPSDNRLIASASAGNLVLA